MAEDLDTDISLLGDLGSELAAKKPATEVAGFVDFIPVRFFLVNAC
jgi:hypothetical protein